jgi:molybdate transport system substrate-binding protein
MPKPEGPTAMFDRWRGLLLVLGLGVSTLVAAEDRPAVFAAASLTGVLERIGEAYARGGAARPRFSFAATSALARQIEAGADADVFISADEAWMDYLLERRLVARPSPPVARNRLVLIAPSDSPLAPFRLAAGADFSGLLGGGRLALGDPAHVPAGRYARAALDALGAWSAVEKSLLPLDNVRVVLTVVGLGEAPLGIVYATDAAGDARTKVLAEFPPDSHPPIAYPAARVLRGRAAVADAFIDYLRSDAARAILREAGFGLPE